MNSLLSKIQISRLLLKPRSRFRFSTSETHRSDETEKKKFRHYPLKDFKDYTTYILNNFQPLNFVVEKEEKNKDQVFKFWDSILEDILESRLRIPILPPPPPPPPDPDIRTPSFKSPNSKTRQQTNELLESLQNLSSLESLDHFVLYTAHRYNNLEMAISYIDFMKMKHGRTMALNNRRYLLKSLIMIENYHPYDEEKILSFLNETRGMLMDNDEDPRVPLEIKKHFLIYTSLAISNTSTQWRESIQYLMPRFECYKHLDMEEKNLDNSIITSSSSSSSSSNKISTPLRIVARANVINKLIDAGEYEKMWDLMDRHAFSSNDFSYLSNQYTPQTQKYIDSPFIHFVNTRNSLEELLPLLKYFRDNEVIISMDVAKVIKNFSLKQSDCYSSKIAKVNKFVAKCNVCGSYLNKVQFTDDQIQHLKNVIYSNCIKKDIFRDSNPEEIEKFEKFLKKSEPYDLIVDGQNVALSTIPLYSKAHQTKSTMSFRLLEFMKVAKKHFNRILIIINHQFKVFKDKKEIEKLADVYDDLQNTYYSKKKNIPILPQKAYFPKFTIEYPPLFFDRSTDDPFFMIASLAFDQKTCFLSNDKLRQHQFLIKDLEDKKLFQKWQYSHQCEHKIWANLDQGSNKFKYSYSIKSPYKHLIQCQDSPNGHWHIPIINRLENHSKRNLSVLPLDWLCIIPKLNT